MNEGNLLVCGDNFLIKYIFITLNVNKIINNNGREYGYTRQILSIPQVLYQLYCIPFYNE